MASSVSLAMFSLVLFITYLMPITVVGVSKCDIQANDIQSELCDIKEKVAALQTAFSAVVKLQTDVANLWHAVQSQTAKIVEHDNAIKHVGSPSTLQQISDMQKTVSDLQNKTLSIEAKCAVCQKKTGPCDSNPCHNNGSCVSISDGYYCVCAANYTGQHCDQIDPCIDKQPCQNGGKCTNSIIGYICQCNQGYEGPNCGIKTNPCDSQPCEHGLCAPGNDTFTCLCDSSYYGDTCNETLASTVISSGTNTVIPTTGIMGNTGSSLSPAITTTTIGPCEKTSPCNDPANCIDHGPDNYTCECPETSKTNNDPCVRPYYLLPYGFCCTKDICKNTDPDCYTPPDGLTLSSPTSTTPLLSSTSWHSSSSPSASTLGPSTSSSQTTTSTNLTGTQTTGPTNTMPSSASQSSVPSKIPANTNLLPSSTPVTATSTNSAGTQTTVSANTNTMPTSAPVSASVPNPSTSQSSVLSIISANTNPVPSSTPVSATSTNSAGTQTTVSANTNTMPSSASVSESLLNLTTSQSSVPSKMSANTNLLPSSTPVSVTSKNSAGTQTTVPSSTNTLPSSASVSASVPNPSTSQSPVPSIISANINLVPSSTPVSTTSTNSAGTQTTVLANTNTMPSSASVSASVPNPSTSQSSVPSIISAKTNLVPSSTPVSATSTNSAGTQTTVLANTNTMPSSASVPNPSTSQSSVPSTISANTNPIPSSTPITTVPGTHIKVGPCDHGSPCNDPSKCIDNGNGNYTCICPETLLTINDKCLEPYYLLPYGFCCVKDICNNTDPDCFSTSPVVSSNNSQPNSVVSVQTVTFTSQTPQNIQTSTLTTPVSNSGVLTSVNASPIVSGTTTFRTPNPCDSSPCNDPAKCVEDGKGNYTCQCPETLATQADSCLEPYYLQPYGFCCSLNTCNNTAPDCFSSSPIVTNSANASSLHVISSTTTVSSSSPCYNNPCNEPAKCTDTGNGNYKCECPSTPKTANDSCLEPYYLLPYGFCCTKDICKGTDPDCI